MTVFHRILAQNLRRARESRGWSRDHLSELVGLSPNYLSEIETGLKFPRPENLERFCEALELQPWELFSTDQGLIRSQESRDLAFQLKTNFGRWVDGYLETPGITGDRAAEPDPPGPGKS